MSKSSWADPSARKEKYMIYTSQTARTETNQASEHASEVFAGRLCSFTDALWLSATKDRIFAVTGLPFWAPVAGKLLNDPQLQHLFEEGNEILLSLSQDIQLLKDGETVELKVSEKEMISELLQSVLNAPGKLDENGSLRLDLKSPLIGTHYAVNLLLGDRENYPDPLQTTPKSVLDHFGRGSFRSSQEKQVLATRYELNPDINGETANRQFYLTEDGRQIFYSLDAQHNVREAYCVHHNNYSEITYKTNGNLEIKRTIFILPQQDGMPSAVEAQRIAITNNGEHRRDLRIVVTGMFGITDPGTLTSDIIYANVVVESEVCSIDGKPVAVSAHHQPKQCNGEKRFAMLLKNGEGMDEYTSDVNGFLGSGSYDRPEGLFRLSNSHSRRAASFYAMAKSFTVNPGQTVFIDELVGMCEDPEDVREDFKKQLACLYARYRDPEQLDITLQKVIDSAADYRRYLSVNTDDQDLNAYLSNNLPFQVLYQTYISRSFAWTQKSYRETGFREIQDLFASMYYLHAEGKDELVRELLSSWIVNVFELGYAYHNFTTRGKEPGMCSDDQLWLVQAIYRYVRLSGDSEFLKKEFPMAGSDKTRRLIDTLKAILIYSGRISVGRHGLPLLDKADWNDTLRLDKGVLDGPDKEELYYRQLEESGRPFGSPLENSQSESVMNAFLLVIAANNTAYLADLIDEKEIRKLAEEIKKDTAESIRNNCWKGDFFARCLINDERPYRYLGSRGDKLSLDENIDGSYYLNSFSWALLADVADEKQIESMLDVIDHYLKTDAGLKLCTSVNYDLLDVITGTSFYFPGDRENGGVFKHAAMMATVASLKKAKSISDPALAKRLRDLAFFMISKTLPYKTLEDPFVLKGNPRFCTQYNNSQTGENIGPILSGTASWLTLALYEVCGIDIDGDTITFSPVINRPHFAYQLNINGTRLNVEIDGTAAFRMNRNSRLCFDGSLISSSFPLPHDHKAHEIRITL
ncbi:MAG: hypothetical protein IJM79_03435 [Erysipelotrichaceae bacterium]|nr:hypothetical protein [Erysipelotrichaceae bacterium]